METVDVSPFLRAAQYSVQQIKQGGVRYTRGGGAGRMARLYALTILENN
jgi:hypothetical protein